MDDRTEADFGVARKAHKRGGKNVSSSKRLSSASRVMAPPSFLKHQQNPSQISKATRNNDNYSAGLWEWYYDEDDPGSVDDQQLRNIRGFIMKRRKSPLKGYQKRYFVLEKGCLYFTRSYTQMVKGKVTGMLDLGLAFVHYDASTKRIDVDGENHVLHLKMKNASHFAAWSSALLAHEEYRKNHVVAGNLLDSKSMSVQTTSTSKFKPDSSHGARPGDDINDWVDKTRRTIATIKKEMEGIHEGLETMSAYIRSSPRDSVISGLSAGHTNTSTEKLAVAVGDASVHETVSMPLFDAPPPRQDSNGTGGATVTPGGVSSNAQVPVASSSKKKFAIRKHKKDKKKDTSSIHMSPEQAALVVQGGGSGGSYPAEESVLSQGVGVNDATMGRDDFTAVAKLVYAQFCELMERLEKLDTGLAQAVEHHTTTVMRQDSQISNQLQLLRQTMSQNSELRDRLAQIQTLCSGESSKMKLSTPVGGQPHRTSSMSFRGANSIQRFDSFVSLQSTVSDKFFDAVEDVHDTSSEDEGEISEGEESGEESELDIYSSLSQEMLTKLSGSPGGPPVSNIIPEEEEETTEGSSHDATPDPQIPVTMWKDPTVGMTSRGKVGGALQDVVRRTTLPCPVSELADFSLWSLLRKNIGKDLSKISMPISMNEPLSALQRLCEELEYSSLLDQASRLSDPHDRMVHVACFAVSSYATSFHRAGKKPFNPILGETYECMREDQGFKFIAEQVSHHPPIAACHCTSPNFEFWQDARIKSKFWGKSMEVFPIGVVNVTLPKHGDHYQWQKVTSCIHNVFAGQRWVDQYGEMTITNNDVCSCKLTFVKSSYWNSKKCVVHGDVYDGNGVPVRHLFGTWNEAMYCGADGEDTECIWKAAEMPPDSERYYGFGYFAIQLNELLESEKDRLPCTDCRFRPDQRMLENGEVQDADVEKKHVEQIQREARAERERLGVDWTPNFFHKLVVGDQEKWVSDDTYWTHRDKQFIDIRLPSLW